MRKLLLRVHLDIGIGLVVFEKNVVLGLVFFDERVFERERVHLARRDDVGKVGDILDHAPHLNGLVGSMKILAHAVFEYARLAHVNDRPVLIEHDIHAGGIG